MAHLGARTHPSHLLPGAWSSSGGGSVGARRIALHCPLRDACAGRTREFAYHGRRSNTAFELGRGKASLEAIFFQTRPRHFGSARGLFRRITHKKPGLAQLTNAKCVPMTVYS